jgi:hypothetical protein
MRVIARLDTRSLTDFPSAIRAQMHSQEMTLKTPPSSG